MSYCIHIYFLCILNSNIKDLLASCEAIESLLICCESPRTIMDVALFKINLLLLLLYTCNF